MWHQQEGIQATREYSLIKDSHKNHVPSNRFLRFRVLKSFFFFFLDEKKTRLLAAKLGKHQVADFTSGKCAEEKAAGGYLCLPCK